MQSLGDVLEIRMLPTNFEVYCLAPPLLANES